MTNNQVTNHRPIDYVIDAIALALFIFMVYSWSIALA